MLRGRLWCYCLAAVLAIAIPSSIASVSDRASAVPNGLMLNGVADNGVVIKTTKEVSVQKVSVEGGQLVFHTQAFAR